MAVDGGKFQKLAAEASGRGRPEREGFDRSAKMYASPGPALKKYSEFRLHRSSVRDFVLSSL
jgi:hypothetical protein